MAEICPTITARDMYEFRAQMERIESFAMRIHIDLMDGRFAPTTSVKPDQIWWPDNVRADLHVMYQQPFDYTRQFIKLAPQLVIVHAEAEGDFGQFADLLHDQGIKIGVALLPATEVSIIASALALIDHVLIFSGNLGHQGGSKADPNLLPKIAELRRLKPDLEIGWDGGVNDRNAAALVKSGIDVLNVGGFIAHADQPQTAYAILKERSNTV